MPAKEGSANNECKCKIEIIKDGPFIVTGGVPLSGEGKNFPLQESYALCRCGQSHNKPFCDGTHVKINFKGT